MEPEEKLRGEERLWVITFQLFFSSRDALCYSCSENVSLHQFLFSAAVETEAGEKAAKEEAVVENTTPDYAAGLVSAQVLVSPIFSFYFRRGHHTVIEVYWSFFSPSVPSIHCNLKILEIKNYSKVY